MRTTDRMRSDTGVEGMRIDVPGKNELRPNHRDAGTGVLGFAMNTMPVGAFSGGGGKAASGRYTAPAVNAKRGGDGGEPTVQPGEKRQ